MVVGRNALRKDAIMDIGKSKGRFFSIFAIVAIGVAFFSGLRIAPQVMRYTADNYYDEYNLMDIRVVSTLGLTDDDLDEIERKSGVEDVNAAFVIDALVKIRGTESPFKIYSLPMEGDINNVNLVEGRLPRRDNEAVVEIGKQDFLNLPLGSTVWLSSGKDNKDIRDDLNNTAYKIVGKVQTPYYLSFEKGSTDIGNGNIRSFLMIPKDNFKAEVYTDIYVTVNGAKELNSYNDEYMDLIEPVVKDIENIKQRREKARYNELHNAATKELDDGKERYFNERNNAKAKLEKARIQIDDAKKEIIRAKEKIDREEKVFSKTIRDAKTKLNIAERELIENEKEYANGLATFNREKNAAKSSIKDAEANITKGEEGIKQLKKQLYEVEQAIKNPLLPAYMKEELKKNKVYLEGLLNETITKLENGKKEIQLASEKLDLTQKELDRNGLLLIKARQSIEDERNKLLDGEEAGLNQFKTAKAELVKAEQDIKTSETEYLNSKKEADREFSKAWDDIIEAEEEISDIPEAEWYVLDRESHYSFMDYGAAADNIDAIGKVFPIFFALVAALVSLTTMTRMVDEQRVFIGTLKALGYSQMAIISKFIFYAFSATSIGCIAGIAIGYTLFPLIIFNAYGIMYVLPPAILRFDVVLALGISIAAIALTTITTYIASSQELKEEPSSLMRPKAPKMGKRIVLERIPLIWNRFNFSYKVSIRNIFRYKRRFFMTVFGISGCTALLLTGFGVKDSIRTVVDKQFGELFIYDISIALDDEGVKNLKDNKYISDYELIAREQIKLLNGDMEKEINGMIPNNNSNIDRFIRLQNRKTGQLITFPDNGLVLSEQMSKILDVKIGDSLILINNDDEEGMGEVISITENYTQNYLYMSKSYYESIFNTDLELNYALGLLKDNSKEMEDKISTDLLNRKGISNVDFVSSNREQFDNTINSLNYVVLVMIISAGALAFVVLYNLTNVNISERIREIATIKVLGFYDNEVSIYIYRENMILTVIGTWLGLILGIFLHRYIMTTVEMENIMFGLEVDKLSYIYSIALTIVFSIFVNWTMYFKLKNVQMVESLKSVD